MADVTPRLRSSAKMQDFVDLSTVRSGLKREFAFALKAQMEMLMSPKSRTRSGKILHPRLASQKPTRKRRRTLEPSTSFDGRDEVLSPPEHAVELSVPENLIDEQAPEYFVDLSTVRSGLKREFAFALKAQMEKLMSPKSRTRSGKILHPRLAYQKPTRKRRRRLEPSTSFDGREEVLSTPEHAVELSVPENVADEQAPDSDLNAVPSPIQGNEESAEEIPPPIDDSEPSTLAPSQIQTEEKTSPSPADPQPSSLTPATLQNHVFRNWNGKHVTYFRRFSRSKVKSEVEDKSRTEKSKTADEASPIPTIDEPPVTSGQASSAATETPDEVEEAKEERETANEPTIPKKDIELQISKISFTKIPSNVKNLLKTGLLEGMNVKYITRRYKNTQGELRGVIKNGMILCFCDSCQGLKTVSAHHFELHAGSTKRHPSDYIYLENGSTIRDVIRACVQAPLDAMELTIRRAISSEPFESSHIERLASMCDSCLVSKLSRRAAKKSMDRASKIRISKPNLPPSSNDINSGSVTSQKKNSKGRMTTKDLRLHKLVFADDILPDGTEVAYYARGKRLLQGYIKRNGIFCRCCNQVISPSQFEAHAGCPSRRKPYLNIYTSNGVSLHELSISLSKDKRFSAGENDDLCGICADGGDLLLCDICPRAFHKECVGLTSVPCGDWYCPHCQNSHQKEKSSEHNENAIAAGRIAGVDPIEQIIQRCIRIVKTPESDIGGCVLCRLHDFCKSGFSPRTVLLCDQCEREFHVGCLKDHDMGDFKELPEGQWFCSPDCSRIHSDLRRLLTSGPEPLTGLESEVIFKKRDKKGVELVSSVDFSWRLLSGKYATPETRLLLSKALCIFHESFDPIIDIATGKDLMPALVYGRDMREQEFGGIYCSVLIVKSSVVSAGLVRVLGCEVAELPLVATSREYQGQGYFQALFSSIERMLDSLGVKHLVLPAAEEAESIWTNKFGFSKISVDQLNVLAKGCRPTTFLGTSMLHKLVSRPPTNGLEREAEGKPSALSLSSPPLSTVN